jgi:hypothetical protein
MVGRRVSTARPLRPLEKAARLPELDEIHCAQALVTFPAHWTVLVSGWRAHRGHLSYSFSRWTCLLPSYDSRTIPVELHQTRFLSSSEPHVGIASPSPSFFSFCSLFFWFVGPWVRAGHPRGRLRHGRGPPVQLGHHQHGSPQRDGRVGPGRPQSDEADQDPLGRWAKAMANPTLDRHRRPPARPHPLPL